MTSGAWHVTISWPRVSGSPGSRAEAAWSGVGRRGSAGLGQRCL